ncbi:LuxR C-terminal-related transcriptional regulator [Amycolatopsis sp. PS_44_ISF1]|uniref:helix-turn-helix transcriptional regulator n=1 Tax=Amycolatopsis sp. PS_44_ISF1 TaxID=2974917 RepID=UPI0028DFC6F4|nr:LuxR C-terminal-related transcriptional regulator [Amycolatopsis sp. PS_44_ISF1]MDT8913887.1 LuxR C-terminal-related transcriptional regulator [Amycolatopsis sp. PS_44_ISF1]
MPEQLAEPWIDRDQEWSVLAGALAALAGGTGAVVLVEGEPGTGRSRLLGEAVAAAGPHGVVACSARADELSQWTPLAPLTDALGATQWALTRTDDTPVRLSARLLGEIEERARRAPQLIVLDDVQWADPVTLAAVHSFVTQLRDAPVTWLLARGDGTGPARTGSPAARLFDRLEEAGARRLRLAGFSGAAASDLAARILGGEPDEELTALLAEAGGNPALLVALAAGLDEENTVRISDGYAKLVADALPARLTDEVVSRLSGFSADTVGVLEVAAVLGRTFRAADVAELIGRTAADIARAVREVLGSGVLTSDRNGELSFRYGLFRRALVESIPWSVRSALHRQAGLLLLDRGAESREAAVGHLFAGALPGDSQAVSALTTAAARAMDTEPAAAASIAEKALTLISPGDQVAELVATRAAALVRTARLDEAARLLAATPAHSSEPDAAARLRTIAVSIRVRTGERQAATELAADDTAEARAVRLAALAGTETGIALARETAAESGALGATARQVLADSAWSHGETEESLRLLRLAAHCPVADVAGIPLPLPALVLATRLAQLGESEQAEAVLADVAARVRQTGNTLFDAAVAATRAQLALWADRLEDAVAHAGTGAPAVLCEAALRSGELVEAEKHLQGYRDRPDSDPATLLWLELQLAAARHEPAGALSPLGGHRPDASLLLHPAAAGWLVRTALAAGEVALAGSVAADAADLAARNPDCTPLAAAAAHAAGLLRGRAGKLREAAAAHGHGWARASAAEDLAELLAREGRPSAEVVRELDVALAAYQTARSRRDVARVRSRLRAAGVRRRHWTYDERPVSGWSSLTDTERTVAKLVAQGLTNRQAAARLYVSPHTVHAHLGRIFRKLGVTSRVELAGVRFKVA